VPYAILAHSYPTRNAARGGRRGEARTKKKVYNTIRRGERSKGLNKKGVEETV
jgi:hypothetical protein